MIDRFHLWLYRRAARRVEVQARRLSHRGAAPRTKREREAFIQGIAQGIIDVERMGSSRAVAELEVLHEAEKMLG